MKDDFDKAEREIRAASQRGAVEDIIHVSAEDGGHDLRVFNPFGANLKQERSEDDDQ